MSVPSKDARSQRALMVEFGLIAVGLATIGLAGVIGVLGALVSLAAGIGYGTAALSTASLIMLMAVTGLARADRGGAGLATRMDRREGRGGRRLTVMAYDGTPLHVEVDGPDDAEVTVVFSHGWMSDLGTWRLQREALRGTSLRRVFYDQRGHGRSGWTGLHEDEVGVRQLADDLAAVIEAAAPTGTVLLVGHSMGGMTVIAFAGRHPEIMRHRVDGVLLCATTARPLAETITLGIPDRFVRTRAVVRRYAGTALSVLGLLPTWLVELLGTAPYRLSSTLFAVGPRGGVEAQVATAGALFRTPLTVGSQCLRALLEHDERGSLGGLDPTRVTVIVPGRDRLVPRADQLEVAALAGGARVVTAPHSGHMVTLEAAELVTAELLGLAVLGMDRPWELLVAS